MKNLKETKLIPIFLVGYLLYLVINQTPIFEIWLIGFVINILWLICEGIIKKENILDKVEKVTHGILTTKTILVFVTIVCLFSFLVPIIGLVLKNKKE